MTETWWQAAYKERAKGYSFSDLTLMKELETLVNTARDAIDGIQSLIGALNENVSLFYHLKNDPNCATALRAWQMVCEVGSDVHKAKDTLREAVKEIVQCFQSRERVLEAV
jgi:hypothetical protein